MQILRGLLSRLRQSGRMNLNGLWNTKSEAAKDSPSTRVAWYMLSIKKILICDGQPIVEIGVDECVLLGSHGRLGEATNDALPPLNRTRYGA